MNKAQEIRHLFYEEPPEDCLGLNCTASKVTYPVTEEYTTSVTLTAYKGSTPVRPDISSLRIAFSTAPNSYQNLVQNTEYLGMKVRCTFNGNEVVLQLSFVKGASFKGTIKVTLSHEGNPLMQTIDIYPEPQPTYLECDIAAVSYNTSTSLLQDFKARLNIDGVSTVADAIQAYFTEPTGNVIAHTSRTYKGVTFLHGSSLGSYRLVVTQGATYQGALILTLIKGTVSRSITIPITRVENGAQGLRGIKGAYVRGPREFMKVVTTYQDSMTEMFYSGADDEPFIDVVLYLGRYYVCKSSHLVSTTSPPNAENNRYWTQFSDQPFVATKLLLAERAKIENLIADGIAMVEIDSETNQPKEIFTVTKDAQGHSIVKATKGLFENVSVRGDISCNTQTFNVPDFPIGDVHMGANTQPNGVIEVTPTGGCLIIPTGKSSYVVKLPKVENNTARQITIINQNLPRKSGDSGNARTCSLIPAEEGVRLFTDLDKCSNNTIIDYAASNQRKLDLPYGVYLLYGYKAEMPIIVGSVYVNRTFTCWSIWRTDKPTDFSLNITNSGYTIGGTQTLPMYNNNIQAI